MTAYPWLEPLEETFEQGLSSGRVPHALLLRGPGGTGKQELAREFATALLCQKQQWPACGDCQSCRWMASGAHPDFSWVSFEINPRTGKLRKEIIVDQVRALASSLQLTASVSPRKGAIIIPADAMNISAANALLKTLEEPQGDTCMILVTDHAARLPATIRSRCQSLDVRLPSGPLALEWLARECGIDEAKGRMALAAAAGSPLRARDLEADGSVGLFIGLAERLDALQAQRGIAGAPISDWLELDERRLWTWLSLHAASRMREVSSSNPAAAGLSRLQLEADRNRALMSTPVRKDLLLQNWLIQWCQLRV